MRNGKTLLRWMVMMAVVTVVSSGVILAPKATIAGTLEATDSGAPSAMVLFPVTEKANPANAAMRPAVFNHLIHEKKIEDCQACHHTGDQVACSSCHTVEGKEEGKFITLERAMHAENIAKRDKDTPSSCVSCHVEQLKKTECAGCHSIIKPARGQEYCGVCHDVATTMTPQQLRQGIQGKLSSSDNEALAEATVAKRTPVPYINPNSIPYNVTIDALADQYEPNTFTHAKHLDSLMKAIKDDKLAAAFHNNPATLCATCHHRSPLSATPPKCGSCHTTANYDAANPDRPTLKAAYHLQCMGCHDSMKVSRPRNTDCTTCHKERAK